MARFVAVIDLGKTNSKLALVDTQHSVEVQVITQPAVVNVDTPYPSLDHEVIKAFVIESLSQLAVAHPIDAITVTTHGATAALIDAEGELVLPVLDYEFQGVDALRASYDQHRPHFRDTGSPALPGGLNIGAQLYWQQAKYPTQFSNAQTILTWPQYWVHWLTGKRFNDATSLGCHTDLYEPRMQRHSSLVSELGWESLMPPVTHSGQFCGELVPSVVNQIGLSKTIPVYTGIHDSNASLVPHLLSQSDAFSVVSTGTWFIVMSVGGDAVTLEESRDTLLNVNAKGSCVPSARFMGGRERDLLEPSSKASENSLSELLSNEINPTMLLPSVVSGTGPYPNAAARWLGTGVESNAAVRDSAISMYLALMTYESMQLIGCTGPTFIEGPLAHDQQFAQMLSALSDRAVFISGAQTGTSVGAAMLISSPTEPPVYDAINLSNDRREQLVRYAKHWQKHVGNHAK